jgi:release factor glutamine methyltransferase
MGRLIAAGCTAADEEASELIAAAHDRQTLESLVSRREGGEPLAWITGRTRFCGVEIHVDPGVYVPRPQSEELVRRAARHLLQRRTGAPQVADLCTGAGAVAAGLRALVPGARIVGTDTEAGSVSCARKNGVTAIRGDLAEPLRAHHFAMITAVAPYIPTFALGLLPRDTREFEPLVALHGGADGLGVVRRVVDSAQLVLRAGGWLLLEIGAEQDEALVPLLESRGFTDIATWHDDEGDLRGIEARLEGIETRQEA